MFNVSKKTVRSMSDLQTEKFVPVWNLYNVEIGHLPEYLQRYFVIFYYFISYGKNNGGLTNYCLGVFLKKISEQIYFIRYMPNAGIMDHHETRFMIHQIDDRDRVRRM